MSTSPTVGIVGGGQLAQMLHQAAISLGVRTVVLSPDDAAPAVRAGAIHVPGRPDDADDLLRLAEASDVVTLDHEHVPTELLAALEGRGHRVAPGPRAAAVGRDKLLARARLGHLVPLAPWAQVSTAAEAEQFAERHGWPVVVKAATGGYDGRGVWVAGAPRELRRLVDGDLRSAQHPPVVLVEPFVRCAHELAVLVARSSRGEVVTYPVAETFQRDGCCQEVVLPAPIDPAMAAEAERIATAAAEAVGLVGVMAVELFATDDGRLLLNELATRPHNSGHVTIEACATSQFENHLRAVLGLPLGSTELRAPAAAMANVLAGPDGTDPFDQVAAALAIPGASVHRYAKAARPGRKLGHITALGPTADAALTIACGARAALSPRQAA